MADLVVFTPAKEHMNQATAFIERDRFGEALNEISITFDTIVKDYERGKDRGMENHYFTLILLFCSAGYV